VKSQRIIQLDLLRLLAVVLVLGRHISPCPKEVNELLHHVTTIWFRGGWIGVDIFFVLSGFLVSGLLFKEFSAKGNISISRFLYRRGYKIYPAFWVLIAVTLIVALFTERYISPEAVIVEVLFLQNYGYGLWNHTWSLAVEEHFYLLLVSGLWLLTWKSGSTAKSLSRIPLIFCFVAIVCLCLRLATALSLPYQHHPHLFPTHLRIDSLLFGVVLSYYFHMRGYFKQIKSVRFSIALIGLGLLCFIPAFLFTLEETWWMSVFGVVLFYLGAGTVLVGSLHYPLQSGGILDWISRIGAYSYSIYLWHMPVETWGTQLTAWLIDRPL
jgi:peptidoglycan/LPS O-acetylase OafA/YrhL